MDQNREPKITYQATSWLVNLAVCNSVMVMVMVIIIIIMKKPVQFEERPVWLMESTDQTPEPEREREECVCVPVDKLAREYGGE